VCVKLAYVCGAAPATQRLKTLFSYTEAGRKPGFFVFVGILVSLARRHSAWASGPPKCDMKRGITFLALWLVIAVLVSGGFIETVPPGGVEWPYYPFVACVPVGAFFYARFAGRALIAAYELSPIKAAGVALPSGCG